jgi:hypothetical protein
MRMPALVSVVAVLFFAGGLMAAAVANSPSIALPGCKSKCGDVDIPYPIGTTPGCYRPGFMVTSPRGGAAPALVGTGPIVPARKGL